MSKTIVRMQVNAAGGSGETISHVGCWMPEWVERTTGSMAAGTNLATSVAGTRDVGGGSGDESQRQMTVDLRVGFCTGGFAQPQWQLPRSPQQQQQRCAPRAATTTGIARGQRLVIQSRATEMRHRRPMTLILRGESSD